MSPAEATAPQTIERLWQTSRFIPQTVRLLGTRYRSLFLAYARQSEPSGENAAVADALSFINFMFKQNRVGLLDLEKKALHNDARHLRRRFKLKREGSSISAVERWKILQWLHL